MQAYTRLLLFVSIRFQVLFHSPNRGTFHLSLTVLVHYRSQKVFSLTRWFWQVPTEFLLDRGTQEHNHQEPSFSRTGLLPPLVLLSNSFLLKMIFLTWSYTLQCIDIMSYNTLLQQFLYEWIKDRSYNAGLVISSYNRVWALPRSLATT